MSTPPRIRGLVDRLEYAVTVYCRCKREEKPAKKHAVTLAKMNLIRAFALVANQDGGKSND